MHLNNIVDSGERGFVLMDGSKVYSPITNYHNFDRSIAQEGHQVGIGLAYLVAGLSSDIVYWTQTPYIEPPVTPIPSSPPPKIRIPPIRRGPRIPPGREWPPFRPPIPPGKEEDKDPDKRKEPVVN